MPRSVGLPLPASTSLCALCCTHVGCRTHSGTGKTAIHPRPEADFTRAGFSGEFHLSFSQSEEGGAVIRRGG